jgi:hypothetical protein
MLLFVPPMRAPYLLYRLHPAKILGDPYSKISPLPSIGDFPCLADSPKIVVSRLDMYMFHIILLKLFLKLLLNICAQD